MAYKNTTHSSETGAATDKVGAVNGPESESGSKQSSSRPNNPVSPQKLAANRVNAQRSTGPKTPEGKEKSKQNSRKHGFFARQPLPPGEEGTKLWLLYSDLINGIWEHYQPIGYMEELLTEKVITEAIRFSRILSYESPLMAKEHAFHSSEVDRILRFQAAIHRQMLQTMHQLEHLQQQRKANPEPAHDGDARAAGPGEFALPAGWCEPLKTQSPTAGDLRASQPNRQTANYETDPRNLGAEKPDGTAVPMAHQETSLADLASRVAGLALTEPAVPNDKKVETNPTASEEQAKTNAKTSI